MGTEQHGQTCRNIHPGRTKSTAGDISFLDRIPPIGGKLAFNINNNTGNLGTLSEINHVNGPTSRKLYFYFGTPYFWKGK